ncbi:hypothetical protein K523DRAFT_355419 [Schizophyllum commune Tattone D]|nr:hypothetical protein K523DRAFT_355419 [Schizophyllum commune Tattone D]
MRKGQKPGYEREQQQTTKYDPCIGWDNERDERDAMDINYYANYSPSPASACRKGRSSAFSMLRKLCTQRARSAELFACFVNLYRLPTASRNTVITAFLKHAHRNNLCCDANWHANTPRAAVDNAWPTPFARGVVELSDGRFYNLVESRMSTSIQHGKFRADSGVSEQHVGRGRTY